MVFEKVVEIGRVVQLTSGQHAGKLAVVVNVVDANRALVDGPRSGVPRGVVNFKNIQLTKFVLKVRVGQRTGKVAKAWDDADMTAKWDETPRAKKLKCIELKAAMTDLDRFKLMKAKQARNRIIRVELGKLKKESRKAA